MKPKDTESQAEIDVEVSWEERFLMGLGMRIRMKMQLIMFH